MAHHYLSVFRNLHVVDSEMIGTFAELRGSCHPVSQYREGFKPISLAVSNACTTLAELPLPRARSVDHQAFLHLKLMRIDADVASIVSQTGDDARIGRQGLHCSQGRLGPARKHLCRSENHWPYAWR